MQDTNGQEAEELLRLDLVGYRAGEKLNLCRSCLFEKLSEYLSTYPAKAVMLYPTVGRNAYQFYRFDQLEMRKDWRRTEGDIEVLKRYLPGFESPCNVCRRPAYFNWCSPAILFDGRDGQKVNILGIRVKEPVEVEQSFLCRDHLLESFREKVTALDLKFDDFIPPCDVDGYCTPWDY